MGLRGSRGFTLIEMIMTIIILSIICTILGSFLLQAYQVFQSSQMISTTDWGGLLVLERMTDDIHNIRSSGDISVIQPTQLTFVDVNGNSVNYQFSSGAISRNGVSLATGVQSFNLSYLDENGATTSTASAVSYIVLSVSFSQGNLTQSYSTMVGLREDMS